MSPCSLHKYLDSPSFIAEEEEDRSPYRQRGPSTTMKNCEHRDAVLWRPLGQKSLPVTRWKQETKQETKSLRIKESEQPDGDSSVGSGQCEQKER